ncbi:NAD(P)-binding domain-containing protein [Roseomonas terrae]|jgi:2-dehydropantoate 2-reductase|uniref:2-dehydropantoate 2-reductase n=1 Tax=Neoroseomonas terrae TaxID=424799 RepID=A0ABS5EH40_9PROT|nr:2-dehydropantoate 2-reductase N-terminal domain-containing protein [Neoroseomonas terrae]MBR0650344.1 NAD(P)-binding domain-containing protein [Neoroseomonas terrae]
MAEPIVIWGAGAIGGTIGAYLARAGHDVTFVDVVPEHVAAIEAGKLTIEGPIDSFTTGGKAATPDRVTGKHKLIILAVKAHHTEAATRALAPYLADDGAVVSCQNGLNELVIAEIVGRERTIGSFVNFGADYQEPGRILYGVRGAVVVGELDGATTPRITALHRQLRVFEPDAVLSDNVFGYLWGKAAYGAILKTSALTNDSIADFIADPARKALILAFVREILSVAAAEKARPLGFDGFDPLPFLGDDMAAIDATIARMVTYNRGSAKTHSGIWRDLAVRKRQTDVAAQLAPVRAAAKRHGVQTPLADTLVELIAGIEQGTLPQSGALADRLAAVIRR